MPYALLQSSIGQQTDMHLELCCQFFYHKLSHHRIDGFSLGHEVKFFESLHEAQLALNQLYYFRGDYYNNFYDFTVVHFSMRDEPNQTTERHEVIWRTDLDGFKFRDLSCNTFRVKENPENLAAINALRNMYWKSKQGESRMTQKMC